MSVSDPLILADTGRKEVRKQTPPVKSSNSFKEQDKK